MLFRSRKQLEMCIQSKHIIVKKEDDLKSHLNVTVKNLKSIEQHMQHLKDKNKLQRIELKTLHKNVKYVQQIQNLKEELTESRERNNWLLKHRLEQSVKSRVDYQSSQILSTTGITRLMELRNDRNNSTFRQSRLSVHKRKIGRAHV